MVATSLLCGERVRLAALDEADIDIMASWYQNGEFMRLYGPYPVRPKDRALLAEEIRITSEGQDAFHFAVRRLIDGALIGVASVVEISWPQRNGWLTIGIGDPVDRGRGFGTEAMRLLVDYVFRELNFHRLQVAVLSYNTPAIALYRRLGFLREGVWREYVRRDGAWHDMVLFGMLYQEWALTSGAVVDEGI
jgi:RimJ/RimL family protein N-acetyltransferase